MIRIENNELRANLRSIMESQRARLPDVGLRDFTIEDIESIGSIIDERRLGSSRIIRERLGRHIERAYLGIYALGLLALELSPRDGQPTPLPEEPSDKDADFNPNLLMKNLNVVLANDALACVRLIEDGVESSARAMLRIVLESSWLALVVCMDREEMKRFKSFVSSSKRKRYIKFQTLNSRLEKFERSIGLPSNAVKDLSESRKETYDQHSEAVHISYLTATVGAYGLSFDDPDYLALGLFGVPSASSERTLGELNFALAYYLYLLTSIIVKQYRFRASKDNVHWGIIWALKELLWLEVILNHPELKGGS